MLFNQVWSSPLQKDGKGSSGSNEPRLLEDFSLFLAVSIKISIMVRLTLCFSLWTIIFTCLFWRLIEISKQAIQHLQRLHQVPCDKCVYFTGDYRLKCTVNPVVAMTEGAIGCRDFLHDNQRSICNSCEHQCSDSKKLPKHYLLQAKFINFLK